MSMLINDGCGVSKGCVSMKKGVHGLCYGMR